jgi:hypothetical protein
VGCPPRDPTRFNEAVAFCHGSLPARANIFADLLRASMRPRPIAVANGIVVRFRSAETAASI